MIVITADQVDSTHRVDLAGSAVATVNELFGKGLVLPVDRNAGDEIQAMTEDAATALQVILHLARSEQWSIGCGIGAVRTPLAANTREAAGPSFVAARQAVDAAKRAPHRFSLTVAPGQSLEADDVAPLVDLLLFVRSRRTPEGWELYDLLAAGSTQAEAAATLDISPQAASQRARAAGIRMDLSSQPGLARLLAEANTRA